MSILQQAEPTDRSEEIRRKMDELREQARHLNGKDRIEAERMIDRLNDRIQGFEEGTTENATQDKKIALGAVDAVQMSWADFTESFNKLLRDMKEAAERGS